MSKNSSDTTAAPYSTRTHGTVNTTSHVIANNNTLTSFSILALFFLAYASSVTTMSLPSGFDVGTRVSHCRRHTTKKK